MSRLSINTISGETQSGCVFAEDFKDSQAVIDNNGTRKNSTTINNGAIFNDLYNRIEYSATGLFNRLSSYSTVFVFKPGYLPNDGQNHYFYDTTNGSRYYIVKNGMDQIQIRSGNTALGIVAYSSYSSYWKTDGYNVLVFTSTTGNSNLYLNGNLILNSATAWSPSSPTVLYCGAPYFSGQNFIGIIKSFKIFNRLLTAQEISHYSNFSTLTYFKNQVLYLPLDFASYDPVNNRTLDQSGNGHVAQLGDGSTVSTFPTKNLACKGHYFDSANSQYIQVASHPSFSFGNGTTNNPFSISFLMRLNTEGIFRSICKRGSGSDQEWQLTIAGSNQIYMNCFDDGSNYIGRTATLNVLRLQGKWAHVVGTYNGGTTNSDIAIYVNQIQRDTANSTVGTYVAMSATNQPIEIGKYLTGYADGDLANIRLFNLCLSPVQVSNLYAREMQGINRL